MADIIEGAFGPIVRNTLGDDIRQANLELVQGITLDVIKEITETSGMSEQNAVLGMLHALVGMYAEEEGPLETNIMLIELARPL